MQSKSILFLLPVALTAFGQTVKVVPLPNPSGAKSLQAHWSSTADGSALLSWLEKSSGDSLSLKYAIRRGDKWSEPVWKTQTYFVKARKWARTASSAEKAVSAQGAGTPH